MPLRLIQVTLPAERKKSMIDLADRYDAIDIWWESKSEDGTRTVNILVDRQNQQEVLDSVQLQLNDCDGLAQDNLAFVIAAMVIAPLLGPNLALAFGSALGEKKLIINALKTSVGGILMAIISCIALGYLFDINMRSEQLMDRTIVDFAAIAVALASGAAAVLSLTTLR